MVLPHLFIVQELLANLAIELLDAGIELSFLLSHLLHPLAHVADFPLDFGILVPPNPADGILVSFLDVVDAFQHVGNVIDPALLHFQLLNSNIEINGCIFTRFDELDKFFGEDR